MVLLQRASDFNVLLPRLITDANVASTENLSPATLTLSFEQVAIVDLQTGDLAGVGLMAP